MKKTIKHERVYQIHILLKKMLQYESSLFFDCRLFGINQIHPQTSYFKFHSRLNLDISVYLEAEEDSEEGKNSLFIYHHKSHAVELEEDEKNTEIGRLNQVYCASNSTNNKEIFFWGIIKNLSCFFRYDTSDTLVGFVSKDNLTLDNMLDIVENFFEENHPLLDLTW